MEGALPDDVLWRPKAKFWEGAGVDTLIEQYANEMISEIDFASERGASKWLADKFTRGIDVLPYFQGAIW